ALAQLGLTPEVLARFDATWDDLQADLVTVSTDAKRVVAERGTHYVYRDQPALVAAGMRGLAREARERRARRDASRPGAAAARPRRPHALACSADAGPSRA